MKAIQAIQEALFTAGSLTQKAKVLLLTLTMAPFKSSVPESRGSVTVRAKQLNGVQPFILSFTSVVFLLWHVKKKA